jgi:hypothetical protein
MTEKLDKIKEEFRSRGVNVSEPERRIAIAGFLGFLKRPCRGGACTLTYPWNRFTNLFW